MAVYCALLAGNVATIADSESFVGGMVVAMGRPEDVAKVEDSHTGRWLAPLLERRVEIQPRIGSTRGDIEPMSRQLAL